MRIRKILLALAALLLGCAPARADDLSVVASIKPVHSLAAAVMAGAGAGAGAGEPYLLVTGAGSPHDYALRPSAARRLGQADVVLWIGPRFETFLTRPLESLSAEASIVALSGAAGVRLLPAREGGVWEDTGGDGVSDVDGTWDGHIWLDPRNAAAMATAMARTLAVRDPARAVLYRGNAEALSRRLSELDQELAAALASAAKQPFLVFHDAFQYFERRYGLGALGALVVNPSLPPGARRLAELRREALGARCAFREPGAKGPLFEALVEGTNLRVAELDPEGLRLEPGPDFYFQLMRGLAKTLAGCLGG
jgi:zinc transport system substrate-binding protein